VSDVVVTGPIERVCRICGHLRPCAQVTAGILVKLHLCRRCAEPLAREILSCAPEASYATSPTAKQRGRHYGDGPASRAHPPSPRIFAAPRGTEHVS